MEGCETMEFKVLSREKARRLSFHSDIKNCIIISITDYDSTPNVFHQNHHIKAVIHIQFDDVEKGEEHCMTKQDAKIITSFVNRHIDDVEMIIVHCEAGISRSAGVCAALMKIITNDDSAIFDNPMYCPNMHCYRLMMEQYFGSYDEEEANEKLMKNIAAWRVKEGLD